LRYIFFIGYFAARRVERSETWLKGLSALPMKARAFNRDGD
jgi:hypothetical protein